MKDRKKEERWCREGKYRNWRKVENKAETDDSQKSEKKEKVETGKRDNMDKMKGGGG